MTGLDERDATAPVLRWADYAPGGAAGPPERVAVIRENAATALVRSPATGFTRWVPVSRLAASRPPDVTPVEPAPPPLYPSTRTAPPRPAPWAWPPTPPGVAVLTVPTSHYNDFVGHRGWWAFQRDQGLSAGQRVRFHLEGGPVPYLRVLDATVTWAGTVAPPGTGIAWLPAALVREFVGWYGVVYDGAFDEPRPDWGEERRP